MLSPNLGLEAKENISAGENHERALDQLPIGGQSGQGLIVRHGLDHGGTESPIALTTRVEERFAVSELGQGISQLLARGGMLRDVDDLMGDPVILQPAQGLATGAASGIAEDLNGPGQDQRPNNDFTAPTRLLEPLPAPSSGRVLTVTSPLTVVRQLKR